MFVTNCISKEEGSNIKSGWIITIACVIATGTEWKEAISGVRGDCFRFVAADDYSTGFDIRKKEEGINIEKLFRVQPPGDGNIEQDIRVDLEIYEIGSLDIPCFCSLHTSSVRPYHSSRKYATPPTIERTLTHILMTVFQINLGNPIALIIF